MKKALFIDRDGTLVKEPFDEQLDSFEKLEFVPGVFKGLSFIKENTDFELVMVTNQDGLGTSSFPEESFTPIQDFILNTLKGEGIEFDDILIDRTFEADHAPTRKPGTAMLTKYTDGSYDMSQCYVIGDRDTDVQLAKNLGCKYFKISDTTTWLHIADEIVGGERQAEMHRVTKETDVYVKLNLNGKGVCDICTGLGFFNHMLEQIGRHAGIDLTIKTIGDVNVDEHHTIEDTGIVLGECLKKAIGDKRGIQRYGFCLPMDDCLCQVALDFGGRPWLVWDAEFKREKIGEMPTEMFCHFFKSISDNAAMNLNIKAEGINEHHKIEGIFKAFAKALKMAIKRDVYNMQLPTSKGTL